MLVSPLPPLMICLPLLLQPPLPARLPAASPAVSDGVSRDRWAALAGQTPIADSTGAKHKQKEKEKQEKKEQVLSQKAERDGPHASALKSSHEAHKEVAKPVSSQATAAKKAQSSKDEKSSKKKSKSDKPKTELDNIKKPLTAFMLFSGNRRGFIKAENPGK